MATYKTLLYSFVVLVIADQITAEPEPAGFQFPSFSTNFGGIEFPAIPFFGGSNGSGIFGFPFQLPNFPGLSGLLPTTTAIPGVSGRSKRQANEQAEEGSEHQSRLFFSAFPTITTCNYTAEPGNTCRSCSQSLRCLPNNVGILTRCRGFFRNCNNGRCSLFVSPACSGTAATAATNTTNSTG